jgi:acyl-coenzyme A synthetase/AMP-(fatty) acid ligase
MKATGTDVFGCTPSRLMVLMESEAFLEALDHCTVLINGGEKYPEKLLSALKEKKDRLIFNTYGPTETTVSSNTQELSAYDTVNVGRPLPGVIEYIVDTDGNEVPPGVVGELYIGGIGVARGYKNLPEKTAASFVEYDNERMYRSGDYARWDKNGFVRIFGRLDSQVKLRGLRIELGEIEGLIAVQPHIRKVAVSIRKEGTGHIQADGLAGLQDDTGVGSLNAELVHFSGYHGFRYFAVAIAPAHQLRAQVVHRAILADNEMIADTCPSI